VNYYVNIKLIFYPYQSPYKLRDIRHDNLNAFIGACTEPPNICIITEYCSRGSLKDVLENEAIKLDQMFIASLVFDLIRV
jgi:serine/threonine protein kinase